MRGSVVVVCHKIERKRDREKRKKVWERRERSLKVKREREEKPS
jgi:hypothetical protein